MSSATWSTPSRTPALAGCWTTLHLDSVHYITFVINLLIFIFGRQIINNLSVETVGANQSGCDCCV